MRGFFKTIVKLAVSLLALLLGMVIAATAILVYSNSPPVFSPDAIAGREDVTIESNSVGQTMLRFEVRRGESAQSVGMRLFSAGLIRNQYFWYLLCRYDKEPIKNGQYRITVPLTQIAIHRILVSGRQILLRLTIPEGLTLKKTARLLEEAGVCPAEDFLAAAVDPDIISHYRIPGASMEGYLYPDTYLFPPEYPAEKVVSTMADTFFARIGAINENAADLTPGELHRLVILASIVEREYRLNEEAPLMAGVFFNRLRIGMALQSCATVEYVITEVQGRPHPEVLLTRDTEIRDPYNTYVYPGLPPGPISAPGAISLQAVFSPTSSNYLYFRLIDPADGRHYFSQTLDDHIKAGALYLKGGY